jgi:exopolysaccharide production protein ExoQ
MMNIAGSYDRSMSYKVSYVASVFFLLQSMSALSIIDRSIYGEWPGKPGDKITQTLNLLNIFTCLFLFWAGTRKIKIARFNRALPLVAPSLLLISIVWSVDPGVTFTQGTAYFFVVLGAIGLAEASDGDVLMDLVTLTCGLSAVASVVQFFAFPEPGDFRGIFPQKNVLGQVMVGGVLAGLHGARIKGGRRFRYFCIIALCTAVAFMSKSSTSVLTIVILFWLDILGRLYLKGGPIRMLGICLALISMPIAIFFVMNADLIFDALGKERTLTGRTLIWPYVIDKIGERPILGWGFSAFWSPLNPLAMQISEAIRGENWFTFVIPNAHNGMLEFLLQIGFAGTAFFLFLWLRNFVLAVKCLNGPARQFGVSSVLLLISVLLVGVSEMVLLAAQQLWTVLFFMMGFICEKQLWLARAHGRGGWARPLPDDRQITPSRGAIRSLGELAKIRGMRRMVANIGPVLRSKFPARADRGQSDHRWLGQSQV